MEQFSTTTTLARFIANILPPVWPLKNYTGEEEKPVASWPFFLLHMDITTIPL